MQADPAYTVNVNGTTYSRFSSWGSFERLSAPCSPQLLTIVLSISLFLLMYGFYIGFKLELLAKELLGQLNRDNYDGKAVCSTQDDCQGAKGKQSTAQRKYSFDCRAISSAPHQTTSQPQRDQPNAFSIARKKTPGGLVQILSQKKEPV